MFAVVGLRVDSLSAHVLLSGFAVMQLKVSCLQSQLFCFGVGDPSSQRLGPATSPGVDKKIALGGVCPSPIGGMATNFGGFPISESVRARLKDVVVLVTTNVILVQFSLSADGKDACRERSPTRAGIVCIGWYCVSWKSSLTGQSKRAYVAACEGFGKCLLSLNRQ